MDNLQYRCSFKVNIPAEKLLEEEIRAAKLHIKRVKNLKDIVTIEGIPGPEHNLLAYKLLQKKVINKIIIGQSPNGEVDLEIRDSHVYLHIFDSIKQDPSQMNLDSEINAYEQQYEITRLIEQGIKPIRNQSLIKYAKLFG